jgi:hypothetical protein
MKIKKVGNKLVLEQTKPQKIEEKKDTIQIVQKQQESEIESDPLEYNLELSATVVHEKEILSDTKSENKRLYYILFFLIVVIAAMLVYKFVVKPGSNNTKTENEQIQGNKKDSITMQKTLSNDSKSDTLVNKREDLEKTFDVKSKEDSYIENESKNPSSKDTVKSSSETYSKIRKQSSQNDNGSIDKKPTEQTKPKTTFEK